MKDLLKIILTQVPHYLQNLLRLFTDPKTFLRNHNRYTEQSLAQSLTFFGVSFVVYSVLLFPHLRATGREEQFLNRTVWHLTFVLLFNLLEAGLLFLSWRLVGGRRHIGRYLITFLYTQGVFLLMFAALLLLALGIIQWVAPSLFTLSREAILSGGQVGVSHVQAVINAMLAAGHHQAVYIVFVSMLIALFAPWIWIYACWGAYRELAEVSRVRSFFAATTYLFLFCVLFVIVSLIVLSLSL